MKNRELLPHLGCIWIFCSLSFSVHATVLEQLNTTSLDGDQIQLKLQFDGRPPNASGYAIKQPARIAIDLPETTSQVDKYHKLGAGNAKNITVVESQGKTRLIISLLEPVGYALEEKGRYLLINVGKNVVGKNSTGQSNYSSLYERTQNNETENNHRPTPDYDLEKRVKNIDFRRGEDGAGNLIISLSHPDIISDIDKKNNKLDLLLQDVKLPLSLRQKLDVIDFATPVQFISAKSVPDGTRIVIEPKGNFDYLVWQADTQFTISIKKMFGEQASLALEDTIQYSGERLSLNFQDIEIRSVLQLIADFKDLNLVASDTVEGNVTLRLKNVPWDQALDIVLTAKGLGKRIEDNILTVAPAEELASREQEALESRQKISSLSTLHTELVQINYADASEIASVLQGEKDNRILSERGSIQVITRTNSLLIKETSDKLEEIQSLIKRIDVPVRQVQIESRIVAIDDKVSKNLGVKWSHGDPSNGSGLNDLFTDFSVTGPNINVGFAVDGTLLELELSALEEDNRGEVISQPRVVTADKQTAVIKSGKEIAYQESTSSGATSIAFKEAVLSLEVTPQITPDGRVIMDIQIKNDDTVATATGQSSGNDEDSEESATSDIPIISKNEVKTKVMVNDGQTVVLGGIFRNNQTRSVSKVPFLGDLPGVGHLFRRDTRATTRSEVLIFITPRIISESVALR